MAVAASAHDPRLARSTIFVGGPLMLLSGLHARITGYLHATSRHQLLALPIEPRLHFAAARTRHVRGLVLSALLGTVAIGIGIAAATVRGDRSFAVWALAFDWWVLVAFSVGLEPGIPAISAWLGRRFPEDSAARRLQRSLGGGWTLPEAVVHLYAPAAGIGLAAALSMPVQLAVDRAVDGLSVPDILRAASGAGLAIGVAVFVVAPRIYARGMFEAVPFVAEATKTLAGPPRPEPAPRWAQRVRDPVLRLLVLQFLRETPVPLLRLAVLLGCATWLCLASVPPDGPKWALLCAATGLWLVPASAVARGRALRARLLAALPVPESQRNGVHRASHLWLAAPAAASLSAVLLRWGDRLW
jgi:hypothetical protein